MNFRKPESGIAPEGTPGFHIPTQLDFQELKSRESSADVNGEVVAYVRSVRDKALEVTSLESADLSWRPASVKNGIRCEALLIAGTKIEGIRHIAEFPLPADVVLDAYNRLNYTDIIDMYTTHVESAETIPPAEFAWIQVVWTYDRLFPVGSSRDFCTLDFIDKENLMLVSKDVAHPAVPVTGPPGWASIFSSSLKAPTYRMPLFYALRIVPDPQDAGRCTVVQFQWSDTGGFVPPKEVWKGVRKFGFDNIPKFRSRLEGVAAQGIVLGKDSGPAYLANPLVPRWRQEPSDMIPGLEPEEKARGRAVPPAAVALAVGVAALAVRSRL